MKQRVFLTGASGYLGGVLAEHLARLPEVEYITGIASTQPTAPLPAKVSFEQMDIRSPVLSARMARHTVVVHTAAVVLWPARMSARERDDINFNGLRNVARAARENQVARFIHASSMAAYDPLLACGQSDVSEDFPLGNGRSPFYYWNAKAAAERILNEMLGGTKTVLTLFRPIYIMGPHNQAAARGYRENPVNFPHRNPRRQFVHEHDVAAAFAMAVRSDLPGAFNVVPDDHVRMSDVWRIAGVKSVPTIPLWLASFITWVRWRFFRSPVHPSWVKDMLVDFTGSNRKLKSAGWSPRYGSAEALAATFGVRPEGQARRLEQQPVGNI